MRWYIFLHLTRINSTENRKLLWHDSNCMDSDVAHRNVEPRETEFCPNLLSVQDKKRNRFS